MKRIAFGVACLALVAVVFLAVFPTRALLDQARARRDAKVELHALVARNRALDGEARRLGTDAEIERLARTHYNLVRPGEEAYAVLPSRDDPPVRVTPRLAGQASPRRPWWARAWERLRSAV